MSLPPRTIPLVESTDRAALGAGIGRRLLALLLVGAAVCAGATAHAQDKELEEIEKRKEQVEKLKDDRPKEDFKSLRFSVRPSEFDRVEAGLKPGHWTAVALDIVANNFDFNGRLRVEPLNPTGGGPLSIEGAPFHLTTDRAMRLAKGQLKSIDATLFIPDRVELDGATARRPVRSSVRSAGGVESFALQDLFLCMPAHQYYFVVLASDHNEYVFLQSLPTVRAPTADLDEASRMAHYRVLAPEIKSNAPVPDSAECWTSVAGLLWDRLDPDALTPDQQQAMIDWLHWGGQIVMSGPDTLAMLRGSFLDPYLPVDGIEPLSIDNQSVADLNRQWNVGANRATPLTIAEPWGGVRLEPRRALPTATLVATPAGEPLVVEGRVGRGRIVVTAFRLAQRELSGWPAFDGFFNGCLLRRPARTFSRDDYDDPFVYWSNEDADPFDPALVTPLRYFTRDAAAPVELEVEWQLGGSNRARRAGDVMLDEQLGPYAPQLAGSYYGRNPRESSSIPSGAGTAGWNDNSHASELARRALRQAAGIEVPDSRFVMWTLAAYVIVLVPINGLLFYWIGRIEWAWIAAPVIALVFSGLVIWLTQLNIGFDRAVIEVDVLEAQGDYPRGRLTRYTALYTSLSSSYRLRYDDLGAAALPFPTGVEQRGRQTSQETTLRRIEAAGEGDQATPAAVELDGFAVLSNSTGMTHSEQHVDLGRGLKFERIEGDRGRITNGTPYDIAGAIVAHSHGRAQLGPLPAGASVEIRLVPANDAEPAGGPSPRDVAGVDLSQLVELAIADREAREVRLVGWIERTLPGLKIEPAADKTQGATLVVAHLDYGSLPSPERDVNSLADFPRQPESDAEGEAELVP